MPVSEKVLRLLLAEFPAASRNATGLSLKPNMGRSDTIARVVPSLRVPYVCPTCPTRVAYDAPLSFVAVVPFQFEVGIPAFSNRVLTSALVACRQPSYCMPAANRDVMSLKLMSVVTVQSYQRKLVAVSVVTFIPSLLEGYAGSFPSTRVARTGLMNNREKIRQAISLKKLGMVVAFK